MATSISAAENQDAASHAANVERAMLSSAEDRGHRCGNFHNYYYFNPPSHRLDVLHSGGLLDYIARRIKRRREGGDGNEINKRHRLLDGSSADRQGSGQHCSGANPENRSYCLWYCDLGCNEGDLTISLAQELLQRCRAIDGPRKDSSKYCRFRMSCLGLDVDPALIDRANEKVADVADPKRHEPSAAAIGVDAGVDARFEVCNLCDSDQYMTKCKSFLDRIPLNNATKPRRRFDLITLFSTTMWIHVHAGDDGLRDFLRQTCDMTDMLLIEPQPSKCYRTANARLRKLNRPEIDTVSSQSLAMRQDIETEIYNIISASGFRRVSGNPSEAGSDCEWRAAVEERSKSSADGNPSGEETEETGELKRTAWQRTLQLYVRERDQAG